MAVSRQSDGHSCPASERSQTKDDCAQLAGSLAEQLKSIVDDMDSDFGELSNEVANAADLIKNNLTNAGLASQETSAAMVALVIRMQFADRLSQRLSNLQQNLVYLSDTLQLYPARVPPDEWTALLEKARQSFTMEAEREEFDRLLGTQESAALADDATADNDVVLF